jgi:hypothetical protein
LLLIILLILLLLILNTVNTDTTHFNTDAKDYQYLVVVLWFVVCLLFEQYFCCWCCCCCCCCCITPFSNMFSVKTRFSYYYAIMQHFSDCDGSAIFGISSKNTAISTNTYQHRMLFDLFRTSSMFSLIWVGVHSLMS